MGERPRLELYSGLATLYQSRDYSDLVLFGKDGTRHHVHRAIVCPRSEYFHAAVRERRWRDGNEGHILLSEDDEVVRLMVEYLYLLDYDPVSSQSSETNSLHTTDGSDTMSVRTEPVNYGHVYGTSAVSAFGGPAATGHPHSFSTVFRSRTDSSLTIHALPSAASDFVDFAHPQGPLRRQQRGGRSPRLTPAPDPSPLATRQANLVLHASMYGAAHKYGIDGLKALSLDKFKIQLTRHWDSVEFAEAIHIVYSNTPASDKDMREAVADTLGWHSHLLDKPEIEVAIMEINGLAYELLKRSRRAEPEYLEC